MKHILRPAFGLLLAAGLTLSASAAEIDSQDVYCFGAEQFSPGETELAGICLTQLPEKSQGLLMLGERLLRPGDVLTARQWIPACPPTSATTPSPAASGARSTTSMCARPAATA